VGARKINKGNYLVINTRGSGDQYNSYGQELGGTKDDKNKRENLLRADRGETAHRCDKASQEEPTLEGSRHQWKSSQTTPWQRGGFHDKSRVLGGTSTRRRMDPERRAEKYPTKTGGRGKKPYVAEERSPLKWMASQSRE